MKPFSYWMPTEVVAGAGCIDTLGARCRAFGSRAFIVTGKHSARSSGALDKALAQLPGAAVFDEVEENPSMDTCGRGAAMCRQLGCDFVVAIGGGSPIDAAKAMALLALNEGACADYLGGREDGRPHLPIVAIPTTAGTGSEATPYAVLVEPCDASGGGRARNKVTMRGLFPALALLDPELSVSMPRSVTVNTGLDALSQAMEGIVSRRSTPMGDALAFEACRIVREWLPQAASSPDHLDARAWMLYAAMLSGCVIAQSGTTLVHGMGYYFTLEFGLAHGLANALLLTPLFQYNAHHCPEKVAAIAAALGHPCEPTPASAAKAVAEALHGLLESLGVLPAATDAGVDPARMAWCADEIYPDRARFKNQPGEPTRDEVLQFFEAACAGCAVE